MPLCGGDRGSGARQWGGRKGGTTLGIPSLLILPLIIILNVSRRLNNRGSSLVALPCLFTVFTVRIITQAGRRAQDAFGHSLYN